MVTIGRTAAGIPGHIRAFGVNGELVLWLPAMHEADELPLREGGRLEATATTLGIALGAS
jgi:hypothetical protein